MTYFCMSVVFIMVKVVYSEMAKACAVIAECLLVSSPLSDFSPFWRTIPIWTSVQWEVI